MSPRSADRRAVLGGILVLLLAGASFRGTESDAATGPPVLYRVNAGGAALTGSPAWSADTAAAPSPYVNAAATGNTPYLTATPINQRLHRGCADAVVSTSADAGATGVAASAIVAATSSEAIW